MDISLNGFFRTGNSMYCQNPLKYTRDSSKLCRKNVSQNSRIKLCKNSQSSVKLSKNSQKYPQQYLTDFTAEFRQNFSKVCINSHIRRNNQQDFMEIQ